MKQIEIKDNEINKFTNEINNFKTVILFEIKKGEELLSIIFYSTDSKIHYSFICKNTKRFSEVESRLYKIYPTYEEGENCFYANGPKIKKTKTLEENQIKNSDVIMILPIEE